MANIPDNDMRAQIQLNPRGLQQITAAQFAAKYKSKREVYNFLAIDCKIYLPFDFQNF